MPRASRNIRLIAATLLLGTMPGLAQTDLWQKSEWREAAWEAQGCPPDGSGRSFRDAKFGAFIHFGPDSRRRNCWPGKDPDRPAQQMTVSFGRPGRMDDQATVVRLTFGSMGE